MADTLEMCMTCGNIPCTCGRLYKTASDQDIISAMIHMKEELVERGYLVDPIVINNKTALDFFVSKFIKQPKVLFNEDQIKLITETKLFPNQWVVRICASKTIDDLLKSLDTANEDTCPLVAMAYYFILVHMDHVVEKCVYYEFANYIAKSVFSHGTFNRNVLDKSPTKYDEQLAFLHSVIQEFNSHEDERPEGYLELEAFFNWLYCEHDETLQTPEHRFNRFVDFMLSLCGYSKQKWSSRYANVYKYADELFYQDEALLNVVKQFSVFNQLQARSVLVK